jgi:hypothetical protein
MTHRCEVYADIGRLALNLKESDDENKKFWEDLTVLCSSLTSQVRDKVMDLGIDPREFEPETEMVTQVKNHTSDDEITQVLVDYGKLVNEWFELNFDKVTEGLASVAELRNEETMFINEVIEVIHWYQYFIGIKYKQASSQKDPGNIYDLDYQSGTRKVAIIAIDRTIAAWSIILNELPEFEDEVLQFLVTLIRTRKDILSLHPETMNFIRPGFDETIP